MKCQCLRPPQWAEHPKVTVGPRGPAGAPTVRRGSKGQEGTRRPRDPGEGWGRSPTATGDDARKPSHGPGVPIRHRREKAACETVWAELILPTRQATLIMCHVNCHALPYQVVFKIKPPGAQNTACHTARPSPASPCHCPVP